VKLIDIIKTILVAIVAPLLFAWLTGINKDFPLNTTELANLLVWIAAAIYAGVTGHSRYILNRYKYDIAKQIYAQQQLLKHEVNNT
jgi:hypothetical protein